MTRRQSGFAYIAAVVFLVVVAGIAVALLRLTDTQQSTINGALLAARANLAARGGIEWVFQQPVQRCAPTPQPPQVNHLPDFRNDSGFLVTVSCSYRVFNEGETTEAKGDPVIKHIYRIEAIACNTAGTTCLNPSAANVARPDYVERARVATICMIAGDPCY